MKFAPVTQKRETQKRGREYQRHKIYSHQMDGTFQFQQYNWIKFETFHVALPRSQWAQAHGVGLTWVLS